MERAGVGCRSAPRLYHFRVTSAVSVPPPPLSKKQRFSETTSALGGGGGGGLTHTSSPHGPEARAAGFALEGAGSVDAEAVGTGAGISALICICSGGLRGGTTI